MEERKASKILTEIFKKYKFSNSEKEALLTGIGVLGWSAIAKDRIKRISGRRGVGKR